MRKIITQSKITKGAVLAGEKGLSWHHDGKISVLCLVAFEHTKLMSDEEWHWNLSNSFGTVKISAFELSV